MKKILFLLAIITINSFSQITVEYNGFHTIGDSILEFKSMYPNKKIQVGDPGTNKVWDFSSLVPSSQNTVYVLDPKTTPFAEDFPTATHAYYTNYFNKSWRFYEETKNQIIPIGTGNFVETEKRVDRSEEMPIKYPLRYLDKSSKLIVLEETIKQCKGRDTIKRMKTQNSINLVDAWGDVILPSGSFPSLRLKTTQTFTDYLYKKKGNKWVFIKKIEKGSNLWYQWWTTDKQIKFPVIMFVMQEDKQTPLIANYVQLPPFKTLLQQIPTTIQVYPNPAKNNIVVKSKKQNYYIVIYTLDGKLIKSIQTKKHKNKSKTKVNIKDLSSGAYYVLVRNKKGKAIGKCMFIKTD